MSENKSQSEIPTLTVIALAAGKGTRMKSPLPKVLHPVAGRPMIEKVIFASKKAGAKEVRVIVGHGQALVRQVVEPMGVTCFEQKEQLGTGHAVRCANIDELDGHVIIMNGDHPLIEESDIKDFYSQFKDQRCDLAVVTARLKNPAEFALS